MKTLISFFALATLPYALPSSSVAAPAAKTAVPRSTAAKPVTFQTQTRDFVIYTAQKDGETQPKLVVRADYLAYPADTFYQRFLPAAAPRTPEELLALYTKVKLAPKNSFEEFKTLYTPQTLAEAAKDGGIGEEGRFYKFFRNERGDKPDDDNVKLLHRYDVGNVSYLTDSTDPSFNVLPILRRDDRAYAANYEAGLGVTTTAIRMVNNEAISNEPPKKWPLSHSVQLHTKTGAKGDEHPMLIFFDGRPMDLPVEQAAKDPDDAILNFTFQLVQTYRNGTQQQWLDLWAEADARDFWQSAIEENPSYYRREREQFDDKWGTYYVYFVMDLGKYASVFVGTRQFLTLDLGLTRLDFRKTADGYRLASSWTMSNGEPSFSRDLSFVLGATELEDHIRRLVKPIATLVDKPSSL